MLRKLARALLQVLAERLDPARPEKEKLVRILYLMLLFLAALAAAGCNTTEGFGEDVEATGDAIEEAAEDASDDDDL